MTKSESFSWQPTNKGCTGLNDFGLLRDTPEHNPKPKAYSLYFSRTVLIVGIVAGFTFAICLTLADKYQKSAKISHHYAGYIYEKDGENSEANKSYYNGTESAAAAAAALAAASASAIVDDALLNTIGLRRIRNISKNIRVDDINQLVPITTILHTVNGTGRGANATGRGGRSYVALQTPAANSLGSNTNKVQSKNILNLAELLKRTEVKTVAAEGTGSQKRSTTTEASGMQFAQLENYKHHINAKNLQDLLKYVTCQATDCGGGGDSWQSSTAEGTQTTFGRDAGFAESVELGNRAAGDARIVDDDHRLQAIRDLSSSDFNGDPQLLPGTLNSESNTPVFYVPYDSDQQSKMNILERFHNYRVSNPMDINDLEPMTSTEHRFFHRFSNRMYNTNRDVLETPRMYTSGLEPYLKPPTPPPTALSFTPSYTTAIFQGFEDGNNPPEELKAEATAVEPTTQIKPISLMVEIFPATDFEFPGSLFQDHTPQYPKRQEQATSQSIQSTNPLWLPWKLAPLSQNKMRLFVNLFPQHSRSPN